MNNNTLLLVGGLALVAFMLTRQQQGAQRALPGPGQGGNAQPPAQPARPNQQQPGGGFDVNQAIHVGGQVVDLLSSWFGGDDSGADDYE